MGDVHPQPRTTRKLSAAKVEALADTVVKAQLMEFLKGLL
jgi:hypothetical protein